jgi:hypothetical protein
MKRLFLSKGALILTFYAAGCSQGEEPVESGIKQPRNYSEAELNHLLVRGTTLEKLTNEFGPPVTVYGSDSNSTVFVYSFPFNEKRSPSELAGFSVKIENGEVSRWLPITQGLSTSLRD